MRYIILPFVLLFSFAGFLGCDSNQTDDNPLYQRVAGEYEATTYTEAEFDTGCTFFNALQQGGFFKMTLGADRSVTAARYATGTTSDRILACEPAGSPEAVIEGSYSIRGAALVLNLNKSCGLKWHQSNWLIQDSTLLYLGFDEGRGPCMPEVTLEIVEEESS